MESIYYSGSDAYLYYPAEIIAAACIYLGNLNCEEL